VSAESQRPAGNAASRSARAAHPLALTAALAALRCPLCATPLAQASQSLRCEHGHSFDISRQGYVSLDVGSRRAGTADTPPMVAAREQFLRQGHFAPIARALSSVASRFGPAADDAGIVLDLAGGTGYYLAAVLGSVLARSGICMDLSKPALRRAARIHPRAAAVRRDVWQPFPLADGSASTVMSVFGPRNAQETLRVLSPTGVFLLVTPTARHLGEVIEDLGMLSVDAAKAERLAASMPGFALVAAEALTYRVALSHNDLSNLVVMGPSAHHVTATQLAGRVAVLREPRQVTVSVSIAAYRPQLPTSSSIIR
jgi:23S rRNA (guanine745-N1)-methyltransferase